MGTQNWRCLRSAWMVLVGASAALKNTSITALMWSSTLPPEKLRKVYALIAVTSCLAFSNSTSYWFLELLVPVRDWARLVWNRWYSNARDASVSCRSLNEGERYEKLPRFILSMALPIGGGNADVPIHPNRHQVATANPGSHDCVMKPKKRMHWKPMF